MQMLSSWCSILGYLYPSEFSSEFQGKRWQMSQSEEVRVVDQVLTKKRDCSLWCKNIGEFPAARWQM